MCGTFRGDFVAMCLAKVFLLICTVIKCNLWFFDLFHNNIHLYGNAAAAV